MRLASGYPGRVSTTLSIGCTLPTSGRAADPGAIGALAQTAEELGFDSIWLSDHLVIPEHIDSSYPYSPDGSFPTPPTEPYLEPLAVLSFLAGVTRRARLGTHVLVLPYRHPLLTAKMVATMDQLSGGRIDLGIGVGWMREEFESLGQSTYARRGAATDEQLRILKSVWTEDIVASDGEFYPFVRLGAHPHPLQKPHPPIWIGGHTRAALRRTARYGDGWLPIGARPPANLPPEEIAAGIAQVRAEAQRFGRDPAMIRMCFSTSVVFAEAIADRRPLMGTPDQIAGDLQRYLEVGIDSFVISVGRGDPPAEIERRLRRFAEEVRPALATPARVSP
jgi:probable F420-dependent oxidoreductase